MNGEKPFHPDGPARQFLPTPSPGPCWEVTVDDGAVPGDATPALARLLLDLADRQADETVE